jgi:outer membrane protein TolC
MVEESFGNSPELGALDANIDVQERVLRSATNSFWSPTIALQGQVTNVFSREGEGTEPFSIPQLGFTTLKPKDLSWNIGLNFSFPLFSGGEKFAVRQKALNELTQLRTERDAIAERIEQRIRSALHVAGASNASIEQAKLAAEAAGKSLKVVQDSYSQGLVSIVELLDAQYAALLTDQAAANAVYDFLIDLMEVERAYGRFNFFSTDQRRKAFFEKANAYFEKAGMPIQ